MLNSLGYALLSMLSRKPCSGYELAQYLEVFWQAKHSQIYPLLSKLEQEEMLTHELIEQNGRPDKKIYSLTSKGQNELTSWLAKTPSPPVMRDEFLSKAYAIWLADPFTAQKLFHERIASFQERLDQRKQVLAQMEAELGKDLLNPSSRSFGRYIVHQRKLRLEGEEISWCEWVLSLLTKNTPESSGMRHF